jgi:hypothetical protein
MPTGEHKQKKRTYDALPKPDNLIRYRQAFGRPEERAQGLKNPPLARLAPPNRPTYIRPDWPVRARKRAESADIRR